MTCLNFTQNKRQKFEQGQQRLNELQFCLQKENIYVSKKDLVEAKVETEKMKIETESSKDRKVQINLENDYFILLYKYAQLVLLQSKAKIYEKDGLKKELVEDSIKLEALSPKQLQKRNKKIYKKYFSALDNLK